MENQRNFKVWFITGASRGFGRVWAEAALERGDKVAATARNVDSLTKLTKKYGESVLTLELDVSRPGQAGTAVAEAYDRFGRLDIVLNNAGYSLVGTIEEARVDEVKAMYETNVFGALAVIQAALPLLHEMYRLVFLFPTLLSVFRSLQGCNGALQTCFGSLLCCYSL